MTGPLPSVVLVAVAQQRQEGLQAVGSLRAERRPRPPLRQGGPVDGLFVPPAGEELVRHNDGSSFGDPHE
eukprot:3632112-Lingulodinium_polyedra.AAC.1